MKKQIANYETLLNVTKAISHSMDPEEVALMTVESVQSVLEAKGCALFLFDKKSNQLKIGASFGLSNEYLEKGPIHAMESIAQSLNEGPVAIFDVMDDPRLQYPNEAKKEGIASILSVPMIVGGKTIGAMRVYTAEKWDFTLEDVNFVQAVAQIAGICIAMARYSRGLKSSIDVLKTMKEVKAKQPA